MQTTVLETKLKWKKVHSVLTIYSNPDNQCLMFNHASLKTAADDCKRFNLLQSLTHQIHWRAQCCGSVEELVQTGVIARLKSRLFWYDMQASCICLHGLLALIWMYWHDTHCLDVTADYTSAVSLLCWFQRTEFKISARWLSCNPGYDYFQNSVSCRAQKKARPYEWENLFDGFRTHVCVSHSL